MAKILKLESKPPSLTKWPPGPKICTIELEDPYSAPALGAACASLQDVRDRLAEIKADLVRIEVEAQRLYP